MARFEGHPAFEEVQTREESFVHHTDREGIVAHWASMSFVAALPEGQRTDFLGQLDGMLNKVADIYEEEVDTAVAGLSSLIEPMLILFLALIVGTIVIALFLPIIRIVQLLS